MYIHRCKGDASLTYEDPNAATNAPAFFNGTELPEHPGFTMAVQLGPLHCQRDTILTFSLYL